MGADESHLQFLLFDKRRAIRTFDGPQLATVVSATATDCYVVIGDYSPDVSFGPAPYPRPALHAVTFTPGGTVTPNPHDHDPGVPPAGTECLVVFVGTGVDRPRIVAFYGWPS